MLCERGSLTYVELLNLLEIAHTGKLNYHLKVLGDLITKDADGRYRLTERGELVYQLIMKFPERKGKDTSMSFLNLGKVLLISSILLFVLSIYMAYQNDLQKYSFPLSLVTVASFLFGMTSISNRLLPQTNVKSEFMTRRDVVSMGMLGILLMFLPFFFGLLPLELYRLGTLTISLYMAVLPWGVVWFLSVRRVRCHDLRELLKPPLFASLIIGVFFMVVFVFMVVIEEDLSLTSFLLWLPVFLVSSPILGVLATEAMHRFTCL